jgi:hypothetical protein
MKWPKGLCSSRTIPRRRLGRLRATANALREQSIALKGSKTLLISGPRFLTLGHHRAIQSEPRSPSSHPEAAAQSDELGGL